jgi:hypothetical protein
MKMKCSKSFIVTVVALLIATKYAWYRVQDTYDVRYTGTPDAQGGVEHDVIMWRLRTGKYPTNSPAPLPLPGSNHVPRNLGAGKFQQSKIHLSASVKPLVRQRQVASKTANVAPKNFGDGAQLFERRIALPPFDAADITRGSIRFERQIFLR